MQNVIGIDIGGSHITLSQVNPEERELEPSSYLRKHVDSHSDKENILSKWEIAIGELMENLDKKETIIGIAMPGPFDYEKGIALMLHGKFLDLYEVNIKKELAERLGISESQIYFINDAAAFLEGELFAGAVQGYHRVFGITLGTGLGTSFYKGDVATDEDLWNSPFRESYCEEYLATRWFVKRYKELTGEEIEGTKDLLDKPEDIQEQIFDEYADSLAEFIQKYVSYYDPEVIVIGGNITHAFPQYGPRLRRILERNDIDVEIKTSGIFEDAAILGAASYAIKKEKENSI